MVSANASARGGRWRCEADRVSRLYCPACQATRGGGRFGWMDCSHHEAAKLFQQRVEDVTYPSGAAAYRALVRLLLAETGRCSTPSMFGFADDLLALDGVE